MSEIPELRTWLEISRSAVLHNAATFRRIIGDNVALMAVVKSNAYGHNIHDIASLLSTDIVDRFAVDSVVEALALRDADVTRPILVLGFTLPGNYEFAVKRRIAITISSFEQLDAIESHNIFGLHVHLKVDTGMGRQGFLYVDRYALAMRLKRLEVAGRIVLDGLYTHFTSAKNPRKPGSTQEQLRTFELWRHFFRRERLSFDTAHCAASAATLLYPDTHYDMVRIGMGLYGYFPSSHAEKHLRGGVTLRPALAWKSVVSEVKSVLAGSAVGYDGTHICMRDSKLAIVPVGYWHGIDRALSNKGRVIVNGKYAPILGRVSMSMIAIDVTDIEYVHMLTPVTLLGRDGGCVVDAREHAKLLGTTPYEIIARLNPLMERVIVD